MHCRACDCLLSDEEATNKDPDTGEYSDMCETCLGIVSADLADEDIPSTTLELDDPQFVEMLDEEN